MIPVNFEEVITKAEKDIQNILSTFENQTKIKVIGLRIHETECYDPYQLKHIPTRSIEIEYDRVDWRWAE
jgi:hypothetical protein